MSVNKTSVPPNIHRCLYCGSSDGPFETREHIVPEGLGNTELVLNVGVVCNRCNNVVGSRLDKALIEFEPIEFLRVWYVEQTKKGKYPFVSFPNVNITRTAKDHMNLELLNGDSKSVRIKADGLGFDMDFRGKRKTTPARLQEVARALYKIALGVMYLDFGEKVIQDPDLDYIRRRVQGDEEFNGFMLLNRKFTPKGESHITYNPLTLSNGQPFTAFQFDFHGLEILFTLEQHKLGPEDAAAYAPDYQLLEF